MQALIVLYLYIYITFLEVHTNQKRFQCERPREKRTVLREQKEALGSQVSKVDRVEGRSWFAQKEGVGYVIQNLYKSRILPGKLIQTFRIYSLTSCVMTWWGYIVKRRCLCQDARLQETKHSCITNQTSLFTYQTEWKE